jgi:microcystin-dependent protein
MATVTGLTAERMIAIEDASVIDGEVIGDHLILTKHDGTQIDAGSVVGPAGPTGPAGPAGDLGAVSDWPWAAGNIPASTLLPYGQLLTQAVYPSLQVIADASTLPYGGSAGVNFNLPDYRGRIGAGKDDMGGSAANRITAAVSGINGATLGAVGGAEGITLTTAQLPAHNHTFTTGVESASHTHNLTPYSGAQTYGSANVMSDANAANQGGQKNLNMTTQSANHTHSGTTANQGSGSAHANVQPTIVVNKIIRVL